MKHTYILILFLFVSLNQIVAQRLLFKSYTAENGLSGSDVNCLLQDRIGFIWIGTNNGLNRFDGNEFKIFRQEHNLNNSLSDNSVWSLCEAADGNIWIGTKQGVLNKFNPLTETFSHIKLGDFSSSEISLTSIIQDKSGKLWIGTYSQGLFQYDPSSGKIKNWTINDSGNQSLSNNYITSLLEDSDGIIWISTYSGLNKIDPKHPEKGFTKYFSSESNSSSISNNLVWRINQSKQNKNIIWIGTANGICSYDIVTNQFNRLDIKPDYPLQFSKSFASMVEQNIAGKNILWAATYGGLYKIDLGTNKSEQFIIDKDLSNGLLSNQIDQVLVDRSGVLWMATDKGLNSHSLKFQKFNKIFSKIKSSNSLAELNSSNVKSIVSDSSDNIYFATSDGLFRLSKSNGNASIEKYETLNSYNLWSIEIGNQNNLWIGTYGNGLMNFDLKTRQPKFINIVSPTFKTLAFNYIKSLHQSKDGTLWIGFWGGGLAAYEIKTEHFRFWRHDKQNKQSISFNDIWTLHEDKFGRLWIGTNGGGLNLFLPNGDGSFKSFKYQKENNNSLISNSVSTITEVPANNPLETILLVGTENGLNKVTVKHNDSDIYNLNLTFDKYAEEELYFNSSIMGIVKDDKSNLWISSSTGLIKYDPINDTYLNFDRTDGYNSNIFNSDAHCFSKSGMIVFGTAKGPIIFNPSEINLSSYKPKIVFTDLLVFNKSISPGENSPIQQSITETKEVTLSFNQNVFTLKFSSLDFNSSEQINYMYMMEGFDDTWIKSGSNRSATYTNLNEGTYYFKVKATNSDGQWSGDQALIKIIIKAPWWRTGWAYSFYVLFILLGLFAIRKFEMNRTKLRNELRVRDLESKKLREIENMKSRFFANLSHEFRTPLLLIKGPLEQLIEGRVSNKIESYQLIKRNSEKLQTLIDQLLELSQLEAASIPLRAKYENIIPVLRGLFYSFASLADQKNIIQTFTAENENILLWFDKDKLEKIINNILSNAFKFTPQNGSIIFETKYISVEGVNSLEIIITDTGIGIPRDKVDKIFDRFFQVDDSSRRAHGGSGIGLALVRELVDLHKWKINVESEVNEGTKFIIQIPLEENILEDYQKVKQIEKSVLNKSDDENNVVEEINNSKIKNTDDENIKNVFEKNLIVEKSTILIVEDSEDVSNYIKEILKAEYNILISENGVKGLSIALDKLPDLIISDIMMPEMDGIEFCKKLKSDWQTSHIPVILLTAKASNESKIEGLETGADDYITKPFSYRELSVRIKNLLDQRRVLKEKFSKDLNVLSENITPNKAHKEFFEISVKIVEKFLSDTEFDSEKFAREIFLSRSQLHRKIQSITGQSTGEFIRTIRLKKAAGLILEKKLSVTQIAFEVGFNSPSHFSKAFKQMFNYLPSEFINRSKS